MNFCKETPERILAQLKPHILNRPKDQTIIWSRLAKKKPRYNRLDPDPDPQSDASPPGTRLNTIQKDRRGNIKQQLTKDDWRRFWVDRLRHKVDAPHLTDKDLYDAVERSRRIFLRQRAEDRKEHIDPDLPSCYYWDKFQVADWIGSQHFVQAHKTKEMFLHFGISGRELVTVDATRLLKMGLYELGTIKHVTKAIRKLLGLPETNGLRATARQAPLETFLNLKVRTGTKADKFTFKEFCEEQNLEYEALKLQMADGYQRIPSCCRVEISPTHPNEVKWIPVKRTIPTKKVPSELGESSSGSSVHSSDSDNLLDRIPTVEELATNALLRNAFMPQILNDIVEAVYAKLAEISRQRKEDARRKQEIADQVMRAQLEKSFSDFRITEPEDKLKFVTIIAEELVDDILRAREILEDIDNFQRKIKMTIPENDMKSLQEAVSFYVTNIMTVVVNSALHEMEGSSTALQDKLNDGMSDEFSSSEEDDAEEVSNEEDDADEAKVEVIWDKTFNEDDDNKSQSEFVL